MGKSGSGGNDPSDNKHEQKLQAVLLADSYTNSFHPVTLEPYSSSPGVTAAVGGKSHQRPLALCPLNNVPLLHHTIDFLAGAGVEELFILCSSGADALEEYIQSYVGGNTKSNASSSQDDDYSNFLRRESLAPGAAAAGLHKTLWSSKLSITLLRDAGCTNAGDALRDLDRRNVIKSDPFILIQGDVVTNVDITGVLKEHAERRKKDSAAIMTVLLQEVGGWGLDGDIDDGDEEGVDGNRNNDWKQTYQSRKHQLPPLRSSTDDLLLALDTTHQNRILLWDSHPHNSRSAIPCSFFRENSSSITLTRNYLDVGLDICSPDVLARFSDEFDYRHLREQFVANSVVEEEVGLQSRIFGYFLKRGEYAGRVGDMRRYHRVSMDLLRRWCYPLVPDNYNWNHAVGENHYKDLSCSGRRTSGFDGVSYVVERHLVYRDVGKGHNRSHVGRSTRLMGPLLLGPNGSIGENCLLKRSVLGPNCTIRDECEVVDTHLWGNVRVEKGAKINGAVICEDAVVKSGAIIERGCVIGKGCVVGEGVVLKEFTRITLAEEVDDDDDYSGFGDSEDEESTSSDDEDDDDSDSSEEDEGDSDDDKLSSDGDKFGCGAVDKKVLPPSHSNISDKIVTDHEIVGNDGLGRVWIPSPPEDYDSDDEEDEASGKEKAMKLMKSGSIGYDMTLIYREWQRMQEEDDDRLSEEGINSDEDDDDLMEIDDDGLFDGVGNSPILASSHLDDDGMHVIGRQKGVDVVRELRDICLEHETSSPVENLRIELNSFKFSQNATYGDCCKGAIMAVIEKILEQSENTSSGKLVTSLRKMLDYWGPLFKSICMGSEEEKAIIHALETMALGGGKAATVLGTEPSFRFVLQTLHDREIVNEDAIFAWAEERKEEG
ncbi:hypothetical protein ACHAXS_004382, partial [Conticribra weissflogii]